MEEMLKSVAGAGAAAVITVTLVVHRGLAAQPSTPLVQSLLPWQRQHSLHLHPHTHALSPSCSFIHPIDVLKTRLQVSGGPGARDYKSLGIGGSLAVIAREEGVGGQ